MTYKIAWVQPNFQQGPKELNAHYLPYSAGVIWSYALTDPWIKENFECTDMVWRRDAVEPLAEKLAQNDVVAFSTYVWNHQYNYTLARLVKQLNPNCLIIFGGPEPAITDKDIFRKEPYMDLVICFEGEITFRKVIGAFENKNWEDIPGLLVNRDGEAVSTGEAKRIEALEDIPSPYLSGVFDKIVAENPDVEWNGTLETNRGCPFACTFCDWGSLTYNKVKHFDVQRVYDELEWMAKHRCGFISITDANFGMFPSVITSSPIRLSKYNLDMAIRKRLVSLGQRTKSARLLILLRNFLMPRASTKDLRYRYRALTLTSWKISVEKIWK